MKRLPVVVLVVADLDWVSVLGRGPAPHTGAREIESARCAVARSLPSRPWSGAACASCIQSGLHQSALRVLQVHTTHSH